MPDTPDMLQEMLGILARIEEKLDLCLEQTKRLLDHANLAERPQGAGLGH